MTLCNTLFVDGGVYCGYVSSLGAIECSDYLAANNITSYSNVNAIYDVKANRNILALHSLQGSNLITSNLIIYRGSNILDIDAKIDYGVWIKNGPKFKNNKLTDILGLAIGAAALAGGVAIAVGLKNLFDQFGNFGKDLIDELKDIFDTDNNDNESGQNEKVNVAWANLKNVPTNLAYSGGILGSKDLAFRGDMFVNSASTLYTVSSYNFSYNGFTNSYDYNGVLPIGKKALIDFTSKTGYFDTLTSSSTFGNTYTLNSSGLTANNVTTNQVKVGNFYVTPSGIYLGNPTNVFSSVQLINANGQYIGPINLSQIVDLEALNINRLGTGTIVYDNIAAGVTGGSTTSMDSFANFWNDPPAFTSSG
jgi:hypothetical protein